MLNFYFPIAVLVLTCIGLRKRGFEKDTTSWVSLNYSKISVCLTFSFIYLKARLLVSFHEAGRLWLRCHGQNYFQQVFSLHCYSWRSLLNFLDHFCCFTLCEQCPIRKFFLIGIFKKKNLLIRARFTQSQSLHLNHLPNYTVNCNQHCTVNGVILQLPGIL